MVVQVVRRILDDLTGEEGAETHRIAVDSWRIDIDLTPEHYDELIALLRPYLDSGRNVGGQSPRQVATKAVPKQTRRTQLPDAVPAKELRSWWRSNYRRLNLPVPNEFGRIPVPVKKAYANRNDPAERARTVADTGQDPSA